ncbi:MAG: SufD family Fe-S cluster assembly protein [Candidatus Aenigmarchaeota archaeon]|nr:SufD family Fe-S cluster assembly protein [Candidatus Aenigmarchaeota archaeon]
MIEKIKNISQKNKEPNWLFNFRKENWRLFESLELPKDDEWRYTDLSITNFSHIQPSSSLNIKTKNCLEEKDPNSIKDYLFLAKNKFEALNNAIFSEPKIILAKNNAKINIEFSKTNFTKIFIFVEDQAEINFSLNSSGFNIIQTFLIIKGQATVNVLDNSEKDAVIINEFFADIKNNAKLNYNFGLFGGLINRLKIESQISLNAENKIKGMFFGNEKQHYNIVTNAIHLEEASVNDILVKGALNDYATSSYFGSIVINKRAQKADSYLADHVLLLSENAKANSIPSLKIDANDVKATHGATISQLDEEQIFYLLSRGLNKKEAESLIVQAFFNDVKINNQDAQKIIEAKIS